MEFAHADLWLAGRFFETTCSLPLLSGPLGWAVPGRPLEQNEIVPKHKVLYFKRSSITLPYFTLSSKAFTIGEALEYLT